MINLKRILICVMMALPAITFAQESLSFINGEITPMLLKKASSGNLLKAAESKLLENAQSLNSVNPSTLPIVIYSDNKPTEDEMRLLREYGANAGSSSWIPPVKGHPRGFIITDVPAENLESVLSLDFVRKADLADAMALPLNNKASGKIGADKVWLRGIKGKGVKVAVLDTGLDINPVNPDLPEQVEVRDYSAFPETDDDVENRVNGHGTHVTATLLGRGLLSENNTLNGGGAYKGMAPEAELVFLKIGNDQNGSAKLSAMIEALKDAVEVYKADLINLSYGSWDTYHDGSSPKDQMVDWCYSKGVPVFAAAGNEGASDRHFSGTVNAGDSTGFIKLRVKNSALVKTMLAFNLVWNDGSERRNLRLKYYDALKNEIRACSWPATESERGTESQLSQSTSIVPAGEEIFYLKVINYSASAQQFHIYENYNTRSVTFEDADPNYTITSPGTADHAFTVGAYNSRQGWTAFNGSDNPGNRENEGMISSFSSRGPRIDGLLKPDIAAPGSSVISLRDRDVYTDPNFLWVDNDGVSGGSYDYIVMQGTSMATPVCAGAAALYIESNSRAQAEEVYAALRNSAQRDSLTGNTPNRIYGYGKLDIYKTLEAGLSPFTPVEESEINKPGTFSLDQNYPNPFNASTVITYNIPFESRVRLVIYNLLGEEIEVITDGIVKPGVYRYNFNASALPSGFYLYCLEASGSSGTDGKPYSFREVKKMISLK